MINPGDFYKWLKIFKVPFGGGGAGTFTVNAGAGLTGGGSSPLGGSVTLSLGNTWNEITGTSQVMSSNNSYAANNAAQVDLSLPVTASIGDKIEIFGKGSGGWMVTQNTGQEIFIGTSQTTIGISGMVESTNQYDILILRCITANNRWIGYCPSGNLIVT